jgi:hypothetical protein
MNPQFRNPPPGANDPKAYDDPVTVPAADLAENPYWKRDVRRRYPQLSTVTQSDAVALLEVGSAAQPKQELIGEAGTKQLVAAQEEGQKGLSVAFERNMGLAKDVLGPGGMPPLPSGLGLSADGKKRYEIEQEQSYSSEYVSSSFPMIARKARLSDHTAIHAGTSHEHSPGFGHMAQAYLLRALTVHMARHFIALCMCIHLIFCDAIIVVLNPLCS